ncbi:MAG: 4a-hydroxytetrahydrobiopterin dehydratase [candidate division NC10 bacterium]
MPRPPRLDDAEVAARLSALPGWTVEEGKLHQTFTFRDFPEAWRFMTAVAQEAEALDHHPEWLNIYSRVTVDLITHDAGGITELHFELASRMQVLAEREV